MRTAIVAIAERGLPPGGTALWLARTLGRLDRPCTLVWASLHAAFQDSQPSLPGVEMLYVRLLEDTTNHFPDHPLFRLSGQLAPILRRFDLVYCLAAGHPALGAVRERRFSAARRPFIVTIAEAGVCPPLREMPRPSPDPAEWNRQFGERYQAQHSDRFVCLDPLGRDLLETRGWTLPDDTRTMRLRADEWHGQHEEWLAAAGETAAIPRPMRKLNTDPPVTVCIPHREHGRFLPAALDSLDRQTVDTFTVIVVDDGSSAPESKRVFDEMKERYECRGWTFLRQTHSGPGAARNLAARHARSEYLLFLDADDLALPPLVERLLEAARYSGDDVLVPWSHRLGPGSELRGLAHDPPGVIERLDTPTGNDPIENLAHKVSGGATCLVRRDAFEAVGGFPTRLIAGLEDQALHVGIALGGFSGDVVPEVLCLSRHAPGSFFEATNEILDQETLQRVYGEHLGTLHLPSFAMTFQSIHALQRAARKRATGLSRELDRKTRRTGGLRLLLLVSYWPHPPNSGAFQRWWAMIRYLGARHELTLATFLSAGDGKENHPLLRHCRSVVAVRHGEPRPPRDPSMPQLVRERESLLMVEALERVSREPFDAAIMQQIFLAPYREVIQAPTILGEENIESRLLEQVATQSYRGELTPAFENARRESDLMRQYEDRVWPRFPLRTAVSEDDRQEIQRRANVGETILVANGTDPSVRLRRVRPDTRTLLFSGSLEFFPNVDAVLFFLHEIWPQLSAADSFLQLIVAGRHPTPELRTAAERYGFILVGNPPDMRHVAARASLSVVPLRIGSGTRLKILDSMALGLPVVTTSLGCRGLAVEDGEQLLIRDEPRAFSEAIQQLLTDRPLWERLRENGFRLVEERYAWEKVLDPLDKKLWQLAESH